MAYSLSKRYVFRKNAKRTNHLYSFIYSTIETHNDEPDLTISAVQDIWRVSKTEHNPRTYMQESD